MQTDENELLSEIEAAAMLRQQPRTLTVWRSRGKGPDFIKLGRSVFYRRQVVLDYIASCERRAAA
jgi:hypothetical protein